MVSQKYFFYTSNFFEISLPVDSTKRKGMEVSRNVLATQYVATAEIKRFFLECYLLTAS